MKYFLAVFLLLLNASAYGELNKWVDAEGKIHYSDEAPPPDVKAQTLTAPSAASGALPQKSVAEREAEWNKAQKDKEKTAQKAAQQEESARIKQKNCEGVKANLNALISNSPISTYNDKGEPVRMDDTARQQKIAETREQVDTYCGGE